MEKVVFANMCMIYNDNNEVVVQDRTRTFKGIGFPGGHIEEGESIVDSTIREVFEETGLIVSNLELAGIKNWYEENKKQRYMIFMYKSNSFKGDLVSSEEGEVKWISIDSLLSENLAFGDFDEMLKLFNKKEITELFFKEVEIDNWVGELK